MERSKTAYQFTVVAEHMDFDLGTAMMLYCKRSFGWFKTLKFVDSVDSEDTKWEEKLDEAAKKYVARQELERLGIITEFEIEPVKVKR